MNLLVGATGFVGGHVVEYLFQQGEISKGIFRKGSHLKIMDTNGVQGIEADLLDHESLHEAMEGADTVYNMASPMPEADSDFAKVNTEGLLNLLEVAGESKVKKFIQLSVPEASGLLAGGTSGPGGEYLRSKAEAERLLQEHAKRNSIPEVAIVRAAKAVGSRESSFVVPLLRMIKQGKVVLPSTQTMSFTHAQDIAQAMYKAATGNTASGSVFTVKSFDASPEQFARSLVSIVGLSAEVVKSGLFSKSPLSRFTTEQLKAGLRFEAQPNWKEIGYSPAFGLESTCQEIATWYKKEPWATGEA